MKRDSMLVCLKGHIVNQAFQAHPERNEDFCSKCGEKTLQTCPACAAPIPGGYLYKSPFGNRKSLGSLSRGVSLPLRCTKCGRPFPWERTEFSPTEEQDVNDSEFPGNYWHCLVELKDNKRIGIINDMSFEMLTENVLRPWREERPFAVGGLLVHERRDILQIRLQCTKESNVKYTDIYEAGLRRSNAASARNRANLAFEYGQDFTQELLFAPPPSIATSAAETSSDQELSLLLRICQRIALSARQLTDRRKDKPDYLIEDEYDVQDLLKCILKAHLNHHIREEPIGQVAGFSSKADFAIEAL